MQRAPFSFPLSLTGFHSYSQLQSVTGKEGLHMKMLKELKWEAILTGVLYILLGIVALVIPETMQKTLGYLIGIVLIVAGLISIICYLLRDARENYYHNEFVFGILGIVLGAVVLYKVEIVISLIPFILGVLVLCSGCSKLQDAIDLKRLDYGSWLGLLIVAAINIILGVVLIYNPFKAAILLFRVLGVVLILSGAGDCFSTIYFARKLRRFKHEQDALNTTYEEVDPKEQNSRTQKNRQEEHCEYCIFFVPEGGGYFSSGRYDHQTGAGEDETLRLHGGTGDRCRGQVCGRSQ